MHEAEQVYVERARWGERAYLAMKRFTSSTTRAAVIMLAAAIVAIIVANSAWSEPFVSFWETEVGLFAGTTELGFSLLEIIDDIFMAIFFLLVGLEIKYEMTVGELTNIRTAILPIVAAFGGVVAPSLIYLSLNMGSPDTIHGWGVPTATDIAFALGIMSLLGNRVPNGVRVFLTTLAVADDIIAILIIAIFYGQAPSFAWLAATAVVVLILILMNRRGVYSLAPYLLVGIVLWYCVFRSGVHCTIAGVLLAFTIPTGSRVDLKQFVTWSREKMAHANENYDEAMPISAQSEYLRTVGSVARVTRQITPPATRLEHALHPWVYFLILPLFALTNADVSFGGADLSQLIKNPALLGCFFGLLCGKPIGIVGMSWILVKAKIAKLPQNVNWVHMIGAGILGGVGFTMAIFVANLAFSDPAYIATAKLGILSASALAGIIGFLFLSAQARAARKKGRVYLATSGGEAFAPTLDSHLTRESQRLLDQIDSPLVRQEIEAALKEGSGVAEVVVDLGSMKGGKARGGRFADPYEGAPVVEPEGAPTRAYDKVVAGTADGEGEAGHRRISDEWGTEELPGYVTEAFADVSGEMLSARREPAERDRSGNEGDL